MHKMTSAANNRAGAIYPKYLVLRAHCAGETLAGVPGGGAPMQISRNLEYIFFKDIRKKACLLPFSFAVMHSAGFSCKILRFFYIFLRNFCFISKSCQFKLDTELAFMSDCVALTMSARGESIYLTEI